MGRDLPAGTRVCSPRARLKQVRKRPARTGACGDHRRAGVRGSTDVMLKYGWACLLIVASGATLAQESQESRADAWWTGPMLAASAASLPPGHWLGGPDAFDIISDGHFDSDGHRHAGPYEHDLGSLTYVLYGATDRLTLGVIPRFLYEE